jgi:hypothetical protein
MISSLYTRLAKRPLLLAILTAAFLTVSGQANGQSLTQNQQAVISNLSGSSAAIKQQLALSSAYSSALTSAASTGTIVDPTAYTRATVSEQQRTDYNAALSTFKGTDFYNAQQFFQQQAAAETANLRSAVDQLATAAVDLQKTIAVNQQLQGATDAPSAKVVQNVIANSGMGTEVTAGQVAAFNGSLGLVNSAATQAAAFMRAANSVQITQNTDSLKEAYGGNLAYANASFDYATGALAVSWANMTLMQTGALDSFKQSSESFYTGVVNPYGR